MHIIEVRDSPLNWIAAVYNNHQEGEAYLEKLKEAGFTQAAISTIPVDAYPVYAIERTKTDKRGNTENYFEFTDENGYALLIREQKNHRGEDNWKSYFTVYIFYEAYFQHPFDQGSRMGALDHVHVDNYFLENEDAERGLEHGRIQRMAAAWNLDGLDQLFHKYMADGSKEQREALAVEGYIALFASMDYDFACGKLTDYGIKLLEPMAEKASLLLEKKL